jgi:hypothetical protein
MSASEQHARRALLENDSALLGEVERLARASEVRLPNLELGANLEQSDPALLDDVAAFVRRFVNLTHAACIAVALWVVMTHAFDAFDTSIYLAITSPEKRSGKTRLLEILELLVRNPWLTGRVTAACLVRKIEAQQPTLLLDESDAAFASDKEYSEALRGVLNTGHRRGGSASCCVGKGANVTFRDFPTFCPKAIAGIGKLPDTVADRCLPIRLRRQAPRERVERFRRRDVEPEAIHLRDRITVWTAARLEHLRNSRPSLPESLTDRQQDGAEPLLAIADLLGGKHSQETREALSELFGSTGAQDDSIGVRLLFDIRAAFYGKDRLPSADLVACLIGMEESPWADFEHGKPLIPNALARLLRRYDIAPRTVRIGSKTPKGYHAEQFEDAWARYLPSEAQHPPQCSNDAGLTHFSEAQQECRVAAEKQGKSPANTRVVAAVAVASAPARERRLITGELP